MTTLSELGELGFLRRLLTRPGAESAGLVIGPGEDDAAAWREGDGSYTVASCDTMVEAIHFDFAWLTAREVGWRAVALALGDLAAKGATPAHGLVSFSAPAAWDSELAVELHRGMAEMAAQAGLVLVGGDTTGSPGPVAVSVTVLGRTAHRPRPRSAALPGWKVAVTGRLGAAATALARAMAGLSLAPDQEAALRRPQPRLGEGRRLAEAGLCVGDISDGLVQEMEKFALMAGVGSVIEMGRVPLAPGVSPEEALSSGEEVELVCVGPEVTIVEVAAQLGCDLTIVGELTSGGPVSVRGRGGEEVEIVDHGHRHF